MSQYVNGDTPQSQARIEELQRHIRVLEGRLPDNDVAPYLNAIHHEINRLGEEHRERNDRMLGALTDVLTKLNELIHAQNRTADNFAMLLAGLRFATPQPSTAPTPLRTIAKSNRGRPRLGK